MAKKLANARRSTVPVRVAPHVVTAAAPVAEVIYARIRRDIVFGRLNPGQKLTLRLMKEAYDTSITTLREILTRLSSEALVVAEGARGFEVMPVSTDNLREIASLRVLLEGHALKEPFAAGDMEWEGRVVAAHHKLAVMEKQLAAGARGQAELWKRCDWEFHHALISACESQVLLATHATIYDRYLRYQIITTAYQGEAVNGEHRTLFESVLKRDWRTAQKTLGTHIHECVEQMINGGFIG